MNPRHVDTTAEIDARVLEVQRRWRMLAGAAAIVAGAIGLLWPQSALRVVALLFGVYLIVVGISRITGSVSGATSRTSRAVQVILGGLVVVAGVLCLNNPFGSVTALAWLIGLGWVIDGVASIASVFRRPDGPGDVARGDAATRGRSTGLVVIGGVVSVIAGIVLVAVPYDAVRSLLIVGSVLLLVIGAVTLLVAFIRPASSPSAA
ncbi:uncharacterized membrane protein HdeD (DUF308 family) [Glaciihabitans tibetensis]|uniref:Uncharacterized membrane protein HdeD (DUF308 family) n=1 Tax=Glaciihabitans tibetensis TaxID=1266600 RepID=A0A2T0VIF2_9MICO|nr:DUF308 domain-containing protein [Glaciihabitans tibetensis]PRY70016.1 uncharacterized membrane protein HdeD (DUF308 family) [Glaciihabitans tibetensis]